MFQHPDIRADLARARTAELHGAAVRSSSSAERRRGLRWFRALRSPAATARSYPRMSGLPVTVERPVIGRRVS
jgi:hypothetical protein